MDRRLKRGDVWTAAGGPAYAGKPRPVVILQDDRFDATSSVTVCPLTSDPTEAPLFRIAVEPTPENGLRQRSFIMADKIVTMPRSRLHDRIGQCADEDIVRMNRAVLVFLGLVG